MTGTPSTRGLLDGMAVRFSLRRANFGPRGRVVRRSCPARMDPEDYGEPEVTEICIGTSWTYLGGLFRKSKVDEDVPPCVEINQ